MCDEAVHIDPYSLEFALYHFKIDEICAEAVLIERYSLKLVPDRFKIQQMCAEAVRKAIPIDIWERSIERGPQMVEYVSDRYKTRKTCERAIERISYALEYVPDQYQNLGNVLSKQQTKAIPTEICF